MLPALERDAAGIVTAARTRAARLTTPRAAAALLGPLLATSLERSLSVAEAMEARGYGCPARTRAPERHANRREWAVGVTGATALGLVTAGLIGGATAYRYYDTLGDPLHPAAIAGSAALLGLTALAAGMVRWLR
jgi:energy-coupling factor transport system permease protein